MARKRTNLCIAADFYSAAEVLEVKEFSSFRECILYQRCDRVYTKLVDIVYRVSCIVYTRTYTKFYKYTKIHEIFSLN